MKDEAIPPKNERPTRYRDDPLGGFLFKWEFWLGYVIFVLFFVHFPWTWLASSTNLDWFVSMMAGLVPSIESLAESGRHRPLAGSKLQLSFLHATCAFIMVYKLITQKSHPMFDAKIGWLRFIVAVLMTFFASFIWIGVCLLILTQWEGTGGNAENPSINLHGNKYEVVLVHSLLWVPVWWGLAFIHAALKGIVRRLRGRSAYRRTTS